MSGRTALAIAAILHDYGSNEVQHEAASMLRQQHAEIARLNHDRSRMLELLAIIHRDGGQYAAQHGIENACEDAKAQVLTLLDTINNVDYLCEQARLAERESCAQLCERQPWPHPSTAFSTADQCAAIIRNRSSTNHQKSEIDRLTQELRDLQSLASGMQAAADSLRAERDAAVAQKIVAVAKEREACADLCDLWDASSPKRIAEAIRARVND